MFGLFNKKKKIVSEITIAVSNTVRMCFAATRYIDERGVFHPPYGLWNDSYVVGFLFGLSDWFLHFQFNGRSMKTAERGEIALYVFANICGNDFRQVLAMILEATQTKQNADFNRGINDSATAFLATAGRLKADDPDPIIARAKELAKQQHKMNIEMLQLLGVNDTSTTSSIGTAVLELTLVQHIRDNYLQDEAA